MLALCGFGFLVVPDRMLVYLSTRVSPQARDALVTLWVILFFVFLSWLFVVFQDGRRR